LNETLSHAPLVGIRLWDPWNPTPSDEIRLHASHSARPGKRYPLARSSGGIHALHSIPHLDGSPSFLPAQLLVELDDPSGQVLPVRLEPTLPSDGIWSDPGEAFSGIGPVGSVPLFVHPRRRAPAGWVCLRASLRRESSNAPVPWAVVEVRHGSRILAVGMSSDSGEVVAAFAPPAPGRRPIGMPLDEPFEPGSWTFDVAFRWSPDRLTESVPSLSDLASQPAVPAASDLPDKFKNIRCGPGETILSSGSRPGSSTVLLQA
jgi:hypothetical protein